MHKDLKEVIETSKLVRDQLIAGNATVEAANAVAHNNGRIVSSHALDLRTRMFEAEVSVIDYKAHEVDKRLSDHSDEKPNGAESPKSARSKKSS